MTVLIFCAPIGAHKFNKEIPIFGQVTRGLPFLAFFITFMAFMAFGSTAAAGAAAAGVSTNASRSSVT